MIISNLENEGDIGTTTEYMNGVVFEDGAIQYYTNETGRVVKVSGGYETQYVINNHLGNARMTLKADVNNEPMVLQYDSYYPFGLEMGGMSLISKLTQPIITTTCSDLSERAHEHMSIRAHELGWYDYGARFYDPQLGRWHVVDALASEPEQIDKSVYQYGWNNPVNLTDPDGNCPMCIGALVGAVTDIAIQSVEIALDDKKSFSKDFSVESVAVSALAGATGVGLATKVAKLGTVAKIGIELTHDAAAVAAGQYVTDGKVDVKSATASAVFGKSAGELAGNTVAKQAAKSP